MRRLITAGLLLMVPVLAAAPVLAGSSVASKHAKPTPARACPKSKKGTHPKHPSKCKGNTKSKKSTPRPTATKTVKAATARPTRTPTPRPTRTPTPTSTATATFTATGTATATPTATTPPPSVAAMQLSANANIGYKVAFSICGLPAGATAGLDPVPAIARSDSSSPTGGSAGASLTTTTAHSVPPATYSLPVLTYLEDSSGNRLNQSVGPQDLHPTTVFLTVNQDHTTALSGSSAVLPTQGESCTPVPASFLPVPTPTPAIGDVSLTASVSTQSPLPDGIVTVYGELTVSGKPASNVLIDVKAYTSHGIQECQSQTNQSGVSSCNVVNANAHAGFDVTVQVTTTYDGYYLTAYTSYVE